MQILLCTLIVIQVNLSPGRDINSGVPHRWKMRVFPSAFCVPVAKELVGFMLRPLFLLTQPHTETTGAACVPFD